MCIFARGGEEPLLHIHEVMELGEVTQVERMAKGRVG